MFWVGLTSNTMCLKEENKLVDQPGRVQPIGFRVDTEDCNGSTVFPTGAERKKPTKANSFSSLGACAFIRETNKLRGP